jgi:hypothetical protein
LFVFFFPSGTGVLTQGFELVKQLLEACFQPRVEIRSHCVVQAGLECMILHLQSAGIIGVNP